MAKLTKNLRRARWPVNARVTCACLQRVRLASLARSLAHNAKGTPDFPVQALIDFQNLAQSTLRSVRLLSWQPISGSISCPGRGSTFNLSLTVLDFHYRSGLVLRLCGWFRSVQPAVLIGRPTHGLALSRSARGYNPLRLGFSTSCARYEPALSLAFCPFSLTTTSGVAIAFYSSGY